MQKEKLFLFEKCKGVQFRCVYLIHNGGGFTKHKFKIFCMVVQMSQYSNYQKLT